VKITADGIVKRFDGVTAVNGVSLEVEDGEFLVLLGPSGCGKTTTLRLLAGLEAADEGDIYFGTERVNDLPPKDRDVAMVFQNYSLYPYMKVSDNIAFPLRVRKNLSKAEIAERVAETANLLQISHLLDRRPSETSGGEQQRIALARSIVRHPRAFFMDEPLSNLDANLRVDMRAELQVLHRKLSIATVCVSHDQLDAMTLGTRIAIMDKGQIRQAGPPQEIYSRPVDLFVAAFLGSPPINKLNAELSNGGLMLATGTRAELPGPVTPPPGNGSASRSVVVGMRAENMRIGAADGENSAQGTVFVLEAVGSDQFAYVRLVDGSTVVVRTSPDVRLSLDENVTVSWRSEDMLVFDAESGLRISPA
jgi:multiple sugar transport system ATP-binding protein